MRSFASRRLPAWRSSSGRKYLFAYNGALNTGANYSIGLGYSQDETTLIKTTPAAPALLRAGSGWESTHVKDPCLVQVSSTDYRMWYAGSDGSHFQIGYATSVNGTFWSKYVSNPVLSRGGAGTWDENGVNFPTVFYDPSDGSRPFKMWYLGGSVANQNLKMGYAYSTDGVSWTKSSANPVMSYGVSYAATSLQTPCIIKSGGTFYIFYGGQPGAVAPQGTQLCLATFTDPEGTYTQAAGNPLVAPSTANQSLTANLAINTALITVASTAAFHVNEPCMLFDSTQAQADVYISAINSGTTMTLTANVSRAWTTANTASIRSLYYGSVAPRSILPTSSGYVIFGTAYQQFAPTVLEERAIAFTSSSLTSGWAYDYARGFVIPLGSVWDTNSAENPYVIVG